MRWIIPDANGNTDYSVISEVQNHREMSMKFKVGKSWIVFEIRHRKPYTKKLTPQQVVNTMTAVLPILVAASAISMVAKGTKKRMCYKK